MDPMQPNSEAWLRGPIPGITTVLQPAAHALIQVREEAESLMRDFPEARLWEQPAQLASVGFHLQHMSGVIDRMLTYAAAQPLSPAQFHFLSQEGRQQEGILLSDLLGDLSRQVDIFLEQLSITPEDILTQTRPVGRRRLPSTVIGLLFHAAEHCQRHLGQLLVTSRLLKQLPAAGAEKAAYPPSDRI